MIKINLWLDECPAPPTDNIDTILPYTHTQTHSPGCPDNSSICYHSESPPSIIELVGDSQYCPTCRN